MKEQKLVAVPQPRVIKVSEELPYTFSKEELEAKSKELAGLYDEKARVEDEKKSSASEYKSKLDKIAERSRKLSNHITMGQEIREVECEIRMNTPMEGMKMMVRLDTLENVWNEPKAMTSRDMVQTELFPQIKEAADESMITHSKDEDNHDDDF